MISLLVYIVVLILLSAFFSGVEIAYVSANKLSVEVLKNRGQDRGKLISEFYEKPNEFLSTILVGNNVVLVILTICLSKLLQPWIQPLMGEGTLSVLLTTTIMITLIVLVFGEFLPKAFSQMYANEFLFKASYVIKFFLWLLFIPTWLLTKIANFFMNTFFKIKDKGQEVEELSRIDLEDYINESMSEDEAVDKEILTNALNLGQFKVRDCMVPRNEIIYLDKDADIQEVIEAFKTHKLSRIVVIDGDIENIIGYIHHQKLLKNPSELKKIMTPVIFVPDAMGLKDLLNKFIKERFNLACVVDEYGGITGLITLEDILEEIFGEIDDEHDIEDMVDIKVSDDEYIFAGRLEVSYINETYGLDLPEGDYQTLSGLIVTNEENIPEEGDAITIEGNKFIMESVSDTKIERIRVIKIKVKQDD
jgi:putative hemolysin